MATLRFPVPATRFLHNGKLLTHEEIAALPKRRTPATATMPHACCRYAKPSINAPGYAYAYTCPVHGEKRVGTSD